MNKKKLIFINIFGGYYFITLSADKFYKSYIKIKANFIYLNLIDDIIVLKK